MCRSAQGTGGRLGAPSPLLLLSLPGCTLAAGSGGAAAAGEGFFQLQVELMGFLETPVVTEAPSQSCSPKFPTTACPPSPPSLG